MVCATELALNNKKFRKKHHSAYFDQLKEGQSPDYFVLSCSDSRVSPSIVMEMPLGKMFVHRNIANQAGAWDESFSSSLYYALKHLKVKKIIVKGHTDCGGVKAAWLENDEKELQYWLSNVRSSLPNKKVQPDLSLDELTKLNVLKQIKQIKEHPVYQEHGEDVEVIGYLFHVESGELEELEYKE